ncbi:MAG: hypothetical protein ACYSUI_25220 [Planctomycetota bacterium]|jgi:hypothetical protein
MQARSARRTALVFGLGVGFLLPAAVRGADDFVELPESLRARVRGDQDTEALHALDFILAASLTREQARAVLPVYEEACRLYLGAYQTQAELQPEMVETFTAFLEEDRLNQGFGREVERRTARTNGRAKAARDKHTADMIDLEGQVGAVLTANQRGVAERYKPGYQALARRLARKAERGGVVPPAPKRRVARGDRRSPLADELARAKAELGELNVAIHPRPGVIGRHLLSPAAAKPLYELAELDQPQVIRDAVKCWRHGTRDYPRDTCEQDQERITRLRREISNWNLVNGLHLDREQIRGLVRLIHKREHVLERQQSTDKPLRLTGKELRQARRWLGDQVGEVLRPGQAQVLADFKACLIPPKNLKDPVRVGQAKDNSHLANWLGRARTMKGAGRERAVDRLMTGEEERLGPLSRQRRRMLLAAAQEAAQMSDTEFELSREELVVRIAPADRRAELNKQIDELELALGRPGKIVRLLLNRDMDPVLRLRYRQLGRQPGARRIDLALGPQADNCDQGCALRKR